MRFLRRFLMVRNGRLSPETSDAEVLHQSRCGLVHFAPRRFEPVSFAVIRIGYGLPFTPWHHIQQQGKLRAGIEWGNSPEVCKVLRIECEDMGEAVEIGNFNLSCPETRNIDSHGIRNRDGAAVWRLADVPAASARTVNFQLQTVRLGRHAQRGLGQWRTADITEADEQDGRVVDHACPSLQILGQGPVIASVIVG